MSVQFGSNFKLGRTLHYTEVDKLTTLFERPFISHAYHPRDGKGIEISFSDQDTLPDDIDSTDHNEIACPNRLNQKLIKFLDSIKMPYTQQSDEDYANERFQATPERVEALNNDPFFRMIIGRKSLEGLQKMCDRRKQEVLEWFRGDKK